MQDAVLLPFITRAEWNSRGFDQYSELTDKIIFKDQLNTPASLKSEMSRLMAKQFTAEALKDTFNQLAIAIIQHSRLDDVPPAPNWYSKNSSMGSDKIQMMVSHSVETNSEVPPADKESLLCKAEEGDPQAQYDYAWFNVKGAPWDEPDQFKEYLHWIEKAAENGSPEAQFELAMHLFKAEYIPEDQERALFLMKNAADATEDDEFQYRYGAMHILAHEKYRNTTVAAEYFKLAIAQGEVKSMYELAQLYLKGDGVNKNIPLGFKLLEKAARKGYVAAIKELAIRHDEGNETPKNMEEAEKWYRAAAVQGDTDCMYNLAFIYRKKGDLKSASEWFQKAADHGHRDAQIKTAISYRNGDSGLILDHYKAIEYFRMAADQGEDFALLKIADYYAEGLWIKKDIKESLRLYTMSAQLNNHIAQFLLYSIYKDGEFGVKDEFESLRWLKKAAENGYYLAKICLGNYYKELGSEEKAFQCFKEAAESGDDLAQYELACCYLDGYGTSRNKKEAMRLMRLAAEGGSDEAVSFLKENKPKTIISKFYSAFS
jgi:TPR repeat protein